MQKPNKIYLPACEGCGRFDTLRTAILSMMGIHKPAKHMGYKPVWHGATFTAFPLLDLLSLLTSKSNQMPPPKSLLTMSISFQSQKHNKSRLPDETSCHDHRSTDKTDIPNHPRATTNSPTCHPGTNKSATTIPLPMLTPQAPRVDHGCRGS